MTNSKRPATPPQTVARRRRRRNEKFVVAGVLVVMAAALLIAGRDVIFGEQGERNKGRGAKSEETAGHAALPVEPVVATVEPKPDPLVDDDGRTMWAAPTDGPPLELSYLPPGLQIVLAMRPAALAANAEGEKVLAAAGPIGGRAIQLVEQRTGVPFDTIDRLLVGWRTMLDGDWDATLVVTLASNSASNGASDKLETLLASATREEHRGTSFRVANDWAYYQPADSERDLLVVAMPTTLREILDLDSHPPPLRREMERLVEHSDGSRHVTLLLAPNFLFSDGRGMFAGTMARLRRPLFWFLGDGAHAATVSLDWHQGFFIELLAVPTLDTPPEQLSRTLADRVAELPERIERYILSLSPQPYGRRVVARFPEMVRRLAAYTRQGVENDYALLRCYLPAVAGHNLLMGAELTLAEVPGATASDAGPTAETASPASIRERLRQRTTLRFSRDTLETALRMLAADVGITIEIRGRDLQSEGITKNQSFGIDLADRPAEEILVEILRLANPDKMATGPADPRQKLVYVVAPAGANRSEVVLITTRALATAAGGELPAVFVDGSQ